MARFNLNEVDHYGGQGGTGYFSLKNDKDVAKVRFMYNGVNDIEGYAVHQVEVDGRKRYVNCLREYTEPVDKCPFCKDKQFQLARLFIPIYNVDEGKVQVWERGKKFFSEISSQCARYSNANTPFVSQLFEIERHGVKGDNQTTYGIYPIGQPDNTRLEDLPELPKILGGLVLDKTEEEMLYYLDHGIFPNTSENQVDQVIRRRGEEPQREERPIRRTPAGRTDTF